MFIVWNFSSILRPNVFEVLLVVINWGNGFLDWLISVKFYHKPMVYCAAVSAIFDGRIPDPGQLS